jgi:tetratricopeptide (TPR) repeat protein
MRHGRWLTQRSFTLAAAFALSLSAPMAAHADGGGGGGGSSGDCPPGQVYDNRTGSCVKRQAGVLPDAQLAEYAVVLAKKKRYGEALDVFNTMRNPGAAVTLLPDPDVAEYALVLAKAKRYSEALAVLNRMKDPRTAAALNYRGYVTRHLGRVDEGIGYYLESVRLDPNYEQVREYLGEAYVIKGDVAQAKVQLAAIKAICGNTECEEYEDLEKAIATGKGLTQDLDSFWFVPFPPQIHFTLPLGEDGVDWRFEQRVLDGAFVAALGIRHRGPIAVRWTAVDPARLGHDGLRG